jgi:flagellar hook-associated protein 3 FlgL
VRVSTSWIYSSGAAALTQKQADLVKTQERISAGSSVLVPSDNPVAASNALIAEQSIALTTQYAANQATAQSTLGLTESTLGQVGSALQDIRTLAVQAGDGTLNASDRKSLAVDLRGKIDALMGLANTRDGQGGYLFAGYQDATQPFVRTASNVTYQGDQGSRALQVSAQRTIDVSVSGASVFESARAGNGTFTVAVSPNNTGSGIADTGLVTNPASLTGHAYQVLFHGAPGAMTYDVVDSSAGANVISGAAYVPGMAIGFDGLQFSMSGTPANNDSVAIAPSPRQSIFKTLDDLSATLDASAAGTLGNAAFQTQLGAATAGIDQAYDQVLAVRTGAGARLNELDALGSLNAAQKLSYQSRLSDLTGLDYTAAISTLAQQQTSLQAAQQSYLKVTGLSLFNYL